ncbi:PAS domain S-box protein [Hymenobacter sp. BT664]|uniref:histidine kinase n=1 Tax=Hymenobacter montanus TaxID=2771359 RepID=A0A927BI59_9BACT|nr:PAS domain S-box protein [Hymenobacter montanus]MBD2770432.1 PAS domain S-box protein [Hymenobacter montanus]
MNTNSTTDLKRYDDDPASPSPDVHAALLALRARADRRRHLVTTATEHHSPQDLQRLVQELQVHQIELEMQYEDLLLAQAEVQSTRAQYLDLYDFAPVGYYTLSDTGLVEQLNLCGSQLLGTVRQRLVGRRFALFVAPTHRMEFGQFMARLFAAERPLSCEFPLQREDGTLFYAQIEGSQARDPLDSTATARCRLAVVDITARRKATEALAASEERFRKLFTESSDAVVLVQGFVYVDCNNAALRLLGATHKEQVVGHPAWAPAPDRQPDGRPTADVLRAAVADALRTGSQRCEFVMHQVSGAEIWVEAVLTPIEVGGGAPLVHILWRNVTAEREAAAQLRESKARLKLALEASETGVFTWDVRRNELRWDERSQAIFGRPFDPGSVPAGGFTDGLHPDDRERVRAAVEQALAERTPLALDFRVVGPDAAVRYVSSAGRAVVDARSKMLVFAGVLRDVTTRYATENELHYKTLLLEQLLNNMPMMLARLRPDGQYLEAVGAGLQAIGRHDDELVGRNAFEEFPALREPLQTVLGGGQAEFLLRTSAEGRPVTFQNYGFFDEQRQQAVVLSVDVTEAEQQKKQLQAEKEFTQSLLENSVDGIVAFDHEGRITAWNSQATRYFGHERATMLGHSLFEVLPQFDCPQSQELVSRVLAGESVVLTSQRFKDFPGHYDAYHVPLRQGGEIVGGLITFRDVTERNRLAEEATQLRLRQQQEVLSAILHTQETERKRIAEALHNGLGQLLYAAKLNLEGRAGAPASPRASLKLLHEAIRTTRTISFELTPGILEDFGLRTALQELRKRIAPSHLPVHLHLSGLEQRLRPQVEIAVYRVVQELLNNVMKHAEATEVMVHVAHEAGRIEVSVEDDGKGFDPESLAAQPLAGMGLAGVRNRVALLGGQLSINSRVGRGTIISFELQQ